MNNKTSNFYLSIIFIFVIIILLYLIIKFIIRHNVNIIKYNFIKIKTAKIPLSVHRDKLPRQNTDNAYSYNFWMMINNWNYRINEFKHIFHVGDCNANHTIPGVWLDRNKNNIIIKLGTEGTKRYTSGEIGVKKDNLCLFPYKWNYNKLCLKKPNTNTNINERLGFNQNSPIPDTITIHNCETTSDSASPHGYCPIKLDNNNFVENLDNFGSCKPISMNPFLNKNFLCDNKLAIIKNVTLNQWINICIVINNTNMEIYVNGLLYQTWVSKSLIEVNKGNLYINKWGGYEGLISCFNLYPFVLTSNEIKNIYDKGPLCDEFNINLSPKISCLENIDKVFEIKNSIF